MAAKPKAVEKSKADYFLYSSLTCGQTYVRYKEGPDLPIADGYFVLEGGAGIAKKRGLITPYGVMTPATEEQYEFLKKIDLFNQHVDGGWIKVVKASLLKADPDAVASDMASRDGSAPLVPADFDHLEEKQRPRLNGSLIDEGTKPTTKPRSRPAVHSVAGFQQTFR